MRHQSDKFFQLHYKLLLACFVLGLLALWKDSQYPILYLLSFYALAASCVCCGMGFFYRNHLDRANAIIEFVKAGMIFLLATFLYF
jgi:O-antigen/teichoic acid export membrane protein